MSSVQERLKRAVTILTLVGVWGHVALIPLRKQLLLEARPVDLLYAGYTDFFLSVADLAALAVVAVWALLWPLHRRTLRLGPTALTLPLAALWTWSLITAPWSVDPALSVFHLGPLALFGALYVVMVSEGFGVALVAPGIAAQGLLQTWVSLGQWQTQRSLGLLRLGERELNPDWLGISVVLTPAGRLLRAYGLADHPNILGGCLAFCTVLLAVAALRGPWPWRVIWSACAGVAAAGLLLSFSRSAWLGAAAGLLLVTALYLARRDWRALAPLTITAAIAVIVLAPSANRLSAASEMRLADTNAAQDTSTANRSVAERATLLQATGSLIRDHWFIGVGIGGFPAALLRAEPEYPDNFQPVHNVVLEALTETGVPGMLLYCAALLAPFWLTYRRRSLLLVGPLAGLLTILVAGQLDYYPWLFQPGRAWQVLLWAVWSAEQYRHVVPR